MVSVSKIPFEKKKKKGQQQFYSFLQQRFSSLVSSLVFLGSTCFNAALLQFVHPKSRGRLAVVDQRKVFHPDAELVALLQRHHLPLRGRAHGVAAAAAEVAEGLHHSLGLLVLVAPPQLDLANQGVLGGCLGEGHFGVNVVVAGLLHGQQGLVEVVDALQDRVLGVPLEVTGWKGPEDKCKLLWKVWIAN